MDKKTFQETLEKERLVWDALLAGIDQSQMTEPGASGEMSVKDVIAHITWFEREMVNVLNEQALVGSPLWNLPPDERNAAIWEEGKERPLSTILTESKQVYAQLITALNNFPHDDLTDASLFRDMPPEWIPWQIIAQNSFEHYQHHSIDIKSWLDKL